MEHTAPSAGIPMLEQVRCTLFPPWDSGLTRIPCQQMMPPHKEATSADEQATTVSCQSQSRSHIHQWSLTGINQDRTTNRTADTMTSTLAITNRALTAWSTTQAQVKLRRTHTPTTRTDSSVGPDTSPVSQRIKASMETVISMEPPNIITSALTIMSLPCRDQRLEIPIHIVNRLTPALSMVPWTS